MVGIVQHGRHESAFSASTSPALKRAPFDVSSERAETFAVYSSKRSPSGLRRADTNDRFLTSLEGENEVEQEAILLLISHTHHLRS